jgi:hypothetical protein
MRGSSFCVRTVQVAGRLTCHTPESRLLASSAAAEASSRSAALSVRENSRNFATGGGARSRTGTVALDPGGPEAPAPARLSGRAGIPKPCRAPHQCYRPLPGRHPATGCRQQVHMCTIRFGFDRTEWLQYSCFPLAYSAHSNPTCWLIRRRYASTGESAAADGPAATRSDMETMGYGCCSNRSVESSLLASTSWTMR